MVLVSAWMMLQERVVVVEWRRGLIGWLVLGLIAGWLAGKLGRGRGFGCIGDILLGLIGSVVGGWIFTKLGMCTRIRLCFRWRRQRWERWCWCALRICFLEERTSSGA